MRLKFGAPKAEWRNTAMRIYQNSGGVYRCVSIIRLVSSAVLAFLVKLADAECTGSIPTGVSQRHFVTFKMKCHSAANIIWRLCLLRGGTAGRAATRQTGGWVDSK